MLGLACRDNLKVGFESTTDVTYPVKGSINLPSLKNSVSNGPLTSMEGFVTSTNANRPCLQPDNEAAAWASNHISMGFNHVFKPLVDRFSGDIKATLSHLSTVHNETCGCQTGSSSHEATNRAWNQKKVPFMELQKQSGLDFEDYLNRVLRLLLTHSIRDVAPLSESEFWVTLRTAYPDNTNCNPDSMEEDLADINNLIAKDIGGEPNQVFNSSSPEDFAASGSSLVASASSSPSFNLTNVDELLRLKRKEKHMAPIDCSGVSAAFDVTWKCKPCDRQHRCKTECDHYRLYHNPRHFIPNNPSVPSGLPSELELRLDGIYTGEEGLKPSTRLGPLVGQVSFSLTIISANQKVGKLTGSMDGLAGGRKSLHSRRFHNQTVHFDRPIDREKGA